MSAALEALRARKETRRRLLESELIEISRQIKEMGAVKIVVFGSMASDNIRSSSDLDLLVVMPPVKTGKQWMGKIYEEVDREVDADIIAFTERRAAKIPAHEQIPEACSGHREGHL